MPPAIDEWEGQGQGGWRRAPSWLTKGKDISSHTGGTRPK